MSNAQKGQDIAMQAGKAAKKAGKMLGHGLSALSKKVKEGTQSFKDGMKEDEEVVSAPAAPEAPAVSYGDDEPTAEPVKEEAPKAEPVKAAEDAPVQYDYSLDDE